MCVGSMKFIHQTPPRPEGRRSRSKLKWKLYTKASNICR